jgi:uncharacterized protein YgbK (DUF1537 family)
MMGVIADDLTGAAELGAVGLRHGLRSEIVLQGQPSGQADLVCMDTDSRSCAPEEAGRRAAAAVNRLITSGADWLYKKVDSVLRGPVVAELEAILKQLRLRRALLVPANPSLGRTIHNGQYFVRGNPIHETEFRCDPEYPRTSSSVRDMVGTPVTFPVHVCGVDDAMPDHGIIIGEACTADDLRQWAGRRNSSLLLAGAAEFFGALLAATGHTVLSSPAPVVGAPAGTNELFVCGTTSDSARAFVRASLERGIPVFSLPAELAQGAELAPSVLETIARQAASAFESSRRVLLNIGLPPVGERAIAKRLASDLTQLAERVLRRGHVGHVYAEGGATAVELFRRMGWFRLTVLQELAPGVATLGPQPGNSPRVTIKPGTYSWPHQVQHPSLLTPAS